MELKQSQVESKSNTPFPDSESYYLDRHSVLGGKCWTTRRRLFLTIADELAQSTFARPFVAISRLSTPGDGFVDVSFHQFATANDECSWWIEENLARAEISTPLGI